jgi:SAM-dependent methyltransferase
MLTVDACPVCASASSVEESLPGDAESLRRCADCGAVYAAAYADPAEVYVDGYLRGTARFGPGFDILDERFQRYLLGVNHRRVEQLEAVTGAPGTLLDVGCGAGEFLLAARDRGWEVKGVEPLEDASAHARDAHGLDVATGLLEDSGLPEGTFDVVSAVHVVEHMARATEFMRMIARWARPGGWVLAESPNYNSRLRRRDGGDWRDLKPGEHLFHVTPTSLRRCFVEAGLAPVEVRTPSYVRAPQTLDEALADLARGPRARRVLLPFTRDGHPTRLGWRLLRGLEALNDREDQGMVVFGIARVPQVKP